MRGCPGDCHDFQAKTGAEDFEHMQSVASSMYETSSSDEEHAPRARAQLAAVPPPPGCAMVWPDWAQYVHDGAFGMQDTSDRDDEPAPRVRAQPSAGPVPPPYRLVAGIACAYNRAIAKHRFLQEQAKGIGCGSAGS
jgi:hypothetical protein